LLPLTSTVSPPAVPRDRFPPSELIVGAAYDVTSDDAALSCPPTLTRHDRPRPTPSLLVHSTSVCGVTTTHPVAAHDRPAVTYRAVTVWPTDGPKFDPDTCTRVPPDVGMADRLSDPATATSDVMAGAAYDVATLADDSALVCPPTVTSHRRPDPTPSTLSHRSSTCAVDTTHDVIEYVVPLTP